MTIDALFSDVVVVGGGGAGCRAALEAARMGARVSLVLKGNIGTSGATAYKVTEMAGFNAADGQVDPADCPEEHYRDIIEAGLAMADPKLARVLADGAIGAVSALEEWGVPFERDGQGYLEYRGCFSNRPRTHVIKGHGEPIISALGRELKKLDVQILSNCAATNLFVDDGMCSGIGFLDHKNEYRTIACGAVILATGGAGQLFQTNLNPDDITGDGYVLGYRAGAELINMEFMQVGLGIIHPVKNLLNSWIWAAHPGLYNAGGESFLGTYIPSDLDPTVCMDSKSNHFPFSVRDDSYYIELSIQSEILKGKGTKHGGVFLDCTKIRPDDVAEEGFQKMWPITRDWLLSRGLDTARQPLEISCFEQAVNGGVYTDEKAESSIPGLYAAGEVAGGPHGADRLGGNMMVTCQVFGARAGRFAAEHALSKNRKRSINSKDAITGAKEIDWLLSRKIDCTELRLRLAEMATRSLVILRNEKGVNGFLDFVSSVKDEISHAPEAAEKNRATIDLANLLEVGEIMARAALRRRESRGSHYRSDFPERDDSNYGHAVIIKREGEGTCMSQHSFQPTLS